MKHKNFLYAVLVMALAIPQSVKAYDFSAVAPTGQTLYCNVIPGHGAVRLTSENSTSPFYTSDYPEGDLIIPDSVTDFENGYTYAVTAIGNCAFRDCVGLSSVVIPDGVTTIGGYAFSGCSSLTTVTIGNGVTSIGDDAFRNCNGLTAVVFPAALTTIGISAFESCTGLTSLVIPDGVTSIGNSAFRDCDGLTSLVIGGSVASIGGSAFQGCIGLPSVVIPNGVASIGSLAFSGCTGLTSVAFNADSCILAGSTTDNGQRVFYGCTNITSFVFGDNVKVIPGYLCYGLSNLPSVTISRSVIRIGPWAFGGCTALDSVAFNADNCTSAGSYIRGTFAGCPNLTRLTVGDNVRAIPAYLCLELSSLTSVSLGSGVTAIGKGAFNRCSGLPSIALSDGVTSIGEEAFALCSSLTSVTIPDSVASIGNQAFVSCTGLTSVTIGSSVEEMRGTFLDCLLLMTINSRAENPPVCDGETFAGVSGEAEVNVPCGAAGRYELANYWKNFDHINEDCESIGRADETQTVHVFYRDKGIVVEGADGMEVMVYDALGRKQSGVWKTESGELRIEVPTTGVYLVKVGLAPFRKVVVIK